jgi:hypothetical protein
MQARVQKSTHGTQEGLCLLSDGNEENPEDLGECHE